MIKGFSVNLINLINNALIPLVRLLPIVYKKKIPPEIFIF